MKIFYWIFDWLFGVSKAAEPVKTEPVKGKVKKNRKPYGSVAIWPNCRVPNSHGRKIHCPHCYSSVVVYNMAWSRLKCGSCGKDSAKYRWYTMPNVRDIERIKARKVQRTPLGSSK